MKFKALVFIRLRSQVDDSPGNAVRDCCGRMSELDIKKLRLGKVIDNGWKQRVESMLRRNSKCSLIDSLPIQSWKTGTMN